MPSKTNDKWLIIFLVILIAAGVIWWIVSNIKDSSLQEDPVLLNIKETLLPIHPAVKDLKLYKGDKSYTINKEKIYICLKDENGNYYPTNMLIYVVLHELAHLINKNDIGHTENFRKIFDDLLDKAESLGIYNPSIPPIQNYCTYEDK